jgi:hypothetical protein
MEIHQRFLLPNNDMLYKSATPLQLNTYPTAKYITLLASYLSFMA